MFDAYSKNNRGPHGPGFGYGYPPQPGHGYGYPPPPAPGFGYGHGPPPAYNGHNLNPYGGPPPPNNHGYPNDKPSVGENAHYYGIPVPSRGHSPIPPAPAPLGNGRPSPIPSPGPSPNPYQNGPPPMQKQYSPGPTPTTHGPGSLLLRQSPETHKNILVHPAGQPTSSPPFYSLTSSPKSSKADYVLARGADPNDSGNLVAEIHSHTWSSKYDLIVRGKSCLLKSSSSGSNYKIEIPGMGTFKWMTDTENLSSKMWLKDPGGRTLASYDKSSQKSSVGTWKKFVGGRDREVKLHVGLDGFLVEVLLVSLYAVKMAKEGALEAAGEIVGAVAGA